MISAGTRCSTDMEMKLISILIRFRYALALTSLVLTALIAFGIKNLYLETDYKIYFEEGEPQLVAHEFMEDTYTKTDNLAIMIRAQDGELFTERMMGLVFDITDKGWQTPYVIRVDSVTNFQHTSADNDDLLVRDLVLELDELTPSRLSELKSIALSERQIHKRLVSSDGSTALVNIALELPPEVDPNASAEEQSIQRAARDKSHSEVVAYGNQVIDEIRAVNPDVEMHLTGVSVITNSFASSSEKDGTELVPLMYLIILIALAVFLRSAGAVVGSLLVIACASAASLGLGGWVGYALNAVNVTTPTIVLTIAVCDAVHLLAVYLRNLGMQMEPEEAMSESLRLNIQPITLTSVTTAIGFLTLNFSTSPPFVEMGNMTAMGVIWALVLTFTLLPAVTLLLVRKRKPSETNDRFLTGFAEFVITHRHKVLTLTLIAAVSLIALIPLNVIDDDPITYFKPGVPYRDASEFSLKYMPTVKDMNFNIDCGAPACVNSPKFLENLDRFRLYLESQTGVEHVGTYVDVIKRLNKSMNGDQDSFYVIPERADMAAQYSLMYEMSLPYGLDLNNMLNLDKSSTKVMVFTDNITNGELIALSNRAKTWLESNFESEVSPPGSISLMFAHVGENNIRSMLWGGVLAVIAITITILIALRSLGYALISMIPNSLPAFMAFGIWGVLVGQVNMAVAAVFSIALGILVDDTVHFISKYRRGRLVKGFSPEESIHYAFNNVGSALIITTFVLSIGFGLLATSDFNLNAMAGMLTTITIVIALVFDFLILPPILMLFDRDTKLNA